MKLFTKALSLFAAVTVLAASFAAPVSAVESPSERASGAVDATLLSFDSKNITPLSVTAPDFAPGDTNGDGKVNAKDILRIRKSFVGLLSLSSGEENRADTDCDGRVSGADVLAIRKSLVGLYTLGESTVTAGGAHLSWSSGNKAAQIIASADSFAVSADISRFGFTSENRPYCVVDCIIPAGTNVGAVSATPLFGGRAAGNAAYESSPVTLTNGTAQIPLSSPDGLSLTGILLSFEGSGVSSKSIYLKSVYVCADLHSAEWITANAVGESSSPTPKTLSVDFGGEKTAVRLLNMTNEDKTNTGGGIYHDFKNCKWPSIAVDENDRLYVVCSGERMAHIDPFGATLMATSDDGGKSFSKPTVVSNTILDDRDAGVTYIGDGKLLVSYFTQSAATYMPGGDGYNDVLKPYSAGGGSPSWAAASWDANNHPVGGIIGTHVDILKSVSSLLPDYDTSAASYVVASNDYGASWNTKKLQLSGRATAEMTSMNENFGFVYPGTKVPVTSAHGPLALSYGTLLYAGKIMSGNDLPYDAMGVYKSADDGKTWEYLSEIPRPFGYVANNFHELSVTETADGTLVCAIRTQPSGSMNSINPMYTVYTAFSYDSGLTWTTPAATGLNGTPPHLITMANGDIVVTHSCRTDPRCIYAALSTDNGRTWSNEVKVSGSFLSGDDMGYPASAALSDGTICTVYYGTYHVGSANEGYSSILSSRWTYSFE